MQQKGKSTRFSDTHSSSGSDHFDEEAWAAAQQRRATHAYVMACLPSHRRATLAVNTVHHSSQLMAQERNKRRSTVRLHTVSQTQFLQELPRKASVPTEDLRADLENILMTADDDSDNDSSSFSSHGSSAHHSQPWKVPDRESSFFGRKIENKKSMILLERLKSVAIPIAAKKVVQEQFSMTPLLTRSAPWTRMGRTKLHVAEIWQQLDFWASHFKEIEGRFGNATVSYFRFARWLILLNLYTFLASFFVIVVPFISTTSGRSRGVISTDNTTDRTSSVNKAARCTNTYLSSITKFTDHESIEQVILDFFVGTGWVEETSLFYGQYHNCTFHIGGRSYNYNMGLAYILATGITSLVIFLLILTNSSQSVKATVIDDQMRSSVHYTNIVLCGWDYCIFDEKTANSKMRILCQEFKTDILEQTKRLQRQNRTKRQELVLFVVRVVVNLLVLHILGGSLFLVFYTTNKLLQLRQQTHDPALSMMIQFLPSMTITILNSVIPGIFNLLANLEDYWPAFKLKITLIRTVFVKLSSLGVLTFSLYYTVLLPKSRASFYCAEENKTDTNCCGNYLWQGLRAKRQDGTFTTTTSSVQCWETFVGQEFYKLAIVDFLAVLATTFLIEFPRKFVFDHLKEKSALVNKYGQQEFDIRKNVLQLVYSQTFSWLGTFFVPFLPAMTLFKVFAIFYIKKLSLMKNHAPPQDLYKVSGSNSFFNLILLLSFVLVASVMGYVISSIHPSKSCGPYRVYSEEGYTTWTALVDVIEGWPKWMSSIVFFFGSSAFFAPCFITLCFMMYYFWARAEGYLKMDEILQDQLRLESRDKQILLTRVNDVIENKG